MAKGKQIQGDWNNELDIELHNIGTSAIPSKLFR